MIGNELKLISRFSVKDANLKKIESASLLSKHTLWMYFPSSESLWLFSILKKNQNLAP